MADGISQQTLACTPGAGRRLHEAVARLPMERRPSPSYGSLYWALRLAAFPSTAWLYPFLGLVTSTASAWPSSGAWLLAFPLIVLQLVQLSTLQWQCWTPKATAATVNSSSNINSQQQSTAVTATATTATTQSNEQQHQQPATVNSSNSNGNNSNSTEQRAATERAATTGSNRKSSNSNWANP